MIRCKDGDCIQNQGGVCCHECLIPDCSSMCSDDPERCGRTVSLETDLVQFKSTALEAMNYIAELDKQKKQLEAQDKAVRKELQELMEKYGVKKFENEFLKLTYVDPTTREILDSKRLKAELPAVAKKYTKLSQVNGSVRIEVK